VIDQMGDVMGTGIQFLVFLAIVERWRVAYNNVCSELRTGPPVQYSEFYDNNLRSICSISKKHFSQGGMAVSEWTRSVSTVRDTPVAEHFAPGVNTTSCVAYRPPIAVLPFLLPLSVSYIKQTLCHCGQL
jgi:hypothetical protein